MSELGENVLEFRRSGCKKPGEPYPAHRHGPFVFDDELAECTCKVCGERISPIHVLQRCFDHEEMLKYRWAQLTEQINKLKFKYERQNRVRCEHCSKLTRLRK